MEAVTASHLRVRGYGREPESDDWPVHCDHLAPPSELCAQMCSVAGRSLHALPLMAPYSADGTLLRAATRATSEPPLHRLSRSLCVSEVLPGGVHRPLPTAALSWASDEPAEGRGGVQVSPGVFEAHLMALHFGRPRLHCEDARAIERR